MPTEIRPHDEIGTAFVRLGFYVWQGSPIRSCRRAARKILNSEIRASGTLAQPIRFAPASGWQNLGSLTRPT
jgi:hypothetical protein